MTTQTFAGFSREAIQFLADLAANNDRAWFQPRKADFERLLKGPMEDLCVALADRFAARGLPLTADPKRSPFRIYRDTRFSANKEPYKTHYAATFPWAGVGSAGSAPVEPRTAAEHAHGNGGYFNFQPGSMYLGGGMWMPSKERLLAFRERVLADPAGVRATLADPEFTGWFGGVAPHEALKRVPPGYPADHPGADMLRWKDLVFGRQLADADVLSPDLPDLIADAFAAATPVFRFLATLG